MVIEKEHTPARYPEEEVEAEGEEVVVVVEVEVVEVEEEEEVPRTPLQAAPSTTLSAACRVD